MMNSNQDQQYSSIVKISALTANGNLPQLHAALHEGLDNGLTITEIKEILLQMYAYTGFPRCINSVNSLISVLHEREENGIQDALGVASDPLPTNKSKYDIGTDIQTTLAGKPISFPKGSYVDFIPEIDIFLKEHLFADIVARNAVNLEMREVATIAALTSLGGTDPQLTFHIGAGLNVGLTEAQATAIFSVIEHDVDAEKGKNGSRILQQVIENRQKTA
jgi:4-carboxymuconolactone decarboxylase